MISPDGRELGDAPARGGGEDSLPGEAEAGGEEGGEDAAHLTPRGVGWYGAGGDLLRAKVLHKGLQLRQAGVAAVADSK